MHVAVKQLKEIREQMKKNRLKKRRTSKHKSSDDDDDNKKSSSKKLKKKRKEKSSSADRGKGKGKEGSISVEEERSSPKKKSKQAPDENDSDEGRNLEDAESKGVTKSAEKQKATESGHTESSKEQTDESLDGPEADMAEVTAENDEDAGKQNTKAGRGLRKKSDKKGTDSDSSSDHLDQELKNLGKLPKLKLKIKAGSVKAIGEEPEEGKEESGEVDKTSDSCAAEAAKSKPEDAKKGL